MILSRDFASVWLLNLPMASKRASLPRKTCELFGFGWTSMGNVGRSGDKSVVKSSPTLLMMAGVGPSWDQTALSICSGTGVKMIRTHDLAVTIFEGIRHRLEGEDGDRTENLGAMSVAVRCLRPTQRSEFLPSRGTYTACVSTCRGLRERSPWEAKLDFCHMVYQRAPAPTYCLCP